jgi:CTP:molybdopterin cytidylyltransferase MocA
MTDQGSLFDLDAGMAAKQRGMADALLSDRSQPWQARASVALDRLVATGEWFTADDLVRLVGVPDADHGQNRSNAVGSFFSHAARRGVIVRVGFRPSVRVMGHARTVSVWRGA